MNLIWWEKTVEYKFVMLLSKSNKLFLAPLDGNHERAGDTILSSHNRWVLIEFKKDKSSIQDEKTKFLKYEAAKSELGLIDGHHHLIYGQLTNNNPQELALCGETYFSKQALRSLDEILSSGTGINEFSNYIKQFTKYKKSPRGGSGGGLAINDYSLVAGINNDNKVVECFNLAEFQRSLGLELRQEQHLTRGYDGPSR